MDRYLFRLLVAISAFRFSDAPVVRSAWDAIEKLKHQHIQQLLAKAKAGGSQTQEIEAELERAWDEISQLKRERDQAKEQASELSAELEAQKAAWATVQQAYPKPQFLPGPTIPEPVGHENIPLPDQGVLDMIQLNGPACIKCGRPIDVRQGHFIHSQPNLVAAGRVGFHVPQIVVPAVVNNPVRWAKIHELKLKQGGDRKFLQEILGIAVEEGEREITKKNLMDIWIRH